MMQKRAKLGWQDMKLGLALVGMKQGRHSVSVASDLVQLSRA